MRPASPRRWSPRRRAVLLAAAAWLLAAPASPAGEQAISLAQALEIARARDPLAQADSLAVESARSQGRIARAPRLPALSASLSYQRLSEIDAPSLVLPLPAQLDGPQAIEVSPQYLDQYGATLRVDQMLWDGGRSAAQGRAAGHDEEAARWGLLRTRREADARVMETYWSLQAAQAALRSAREARSVADSQRVLVAASFRAGLALEQDTLQAALRVQRIELQVEQAQAARDNAAEALRIALDLPERTIPVAEDAVAPVVAAPPAGPQPAAPHPPSGSPAGGSPEREHAAESPAEPAPPGERPDVAQARAAAQGLEAQAAAARSALRPYVSAFAQVDYMRPNPRFVPAQDRFDATWKAGLAAQWTLFRGWADAEGARRAALAARQAHLRESAVRDAAALSVARAENDLRLARRRREIAQAALPLARRDLELARIRAIAGSALRLDAIDRAAALAQAEADHAQALAQENAASVRFDLARGDEPRWK